LYLAAAALHLPEPEGGIPDSENKELIVEALSQRYPGNLELLAYKVDRALRRGDPAELVRLLRSAPAAADTDGRFWRAKGWLYLNRNQDAQARQVLEVALQLHPLDWDARNWLADLARRRGDLAEADRLARLVRQARSLRERIKTYNPDDVPRDILLELAEHARECGDLEVAAALSARLKSP
jgi:uncharacterized protein HemY